MATLSESQQRALKEAKNIFSYADSHLSIMNWRKKAFEDYGFYDGTRQWPVSVIADLRARGQDPVIVNKIKNLVNYMSGIEIQTRFRVAFRCHSDNPEHELLAKALTHRIYYEQENQNVPHYGSYKFRDMLITGIGWSNIFKENYQICYEYVNPFNVIFDPDDLSPELTEMDYVIRLRWLPISKAKALWPSKSRYFDSLCSPRSKYCKSNSYSSEILSRTNGYSGIYALGDGSGCGSRILIVEVQTKTNEKAFNGFDANGYYFQTFDEKEAKEMSVNPREIEETMASKIIRTVFIADCLLEYSPLKPNIPNLKDFTYIPSIWSRRFEDGVPEGWISVMKDLQRESNYRRAKLINDLSSFRIFVDPSTISNGMSYEDLVRNLKRPDSVTIVENPREKIVVDDNSKMSGPQFEMLQRTDQELQQVSGVFNDALGEQTNATSGVAIQNRQINSVRNQVFAFDNLKMMKKREGLMFLAFIQGGGDEFIESQVLEAEEQQIILLNISREVDGKRVVFNDVRTLPVDICVEEVPDFESTLDEQQAALEAVLSNPNALLIMQSPELMKRLKIRDYQKLAEEMTQTMQRQQAMQQPQAANVEQMPFNPINPKTNVM